jgi:hypothetical protein
MTSLEDVFLHLETEALCDRIDSLIRDALEEAELIRADLEANAGDTTRGAG